MRLLYPETPTKVQIGDMGIENRIFPVGTRWKRRQVVKGTLLILD